MWAASQSRTFHEKNMAEIKLECAVYGEGTVFPVNILSDAEVSVLQETIFYKQRYNDRYKFPSSALTLYLARKEEGGKTKWLKDDRYVKDFLRGGTSTGYEEMRPSWTLDDEAYFGANFQPRPKQIHVLVELPYLPNKRLRVESVPRIERFEDVPQINIQGVNYVSLPAAFLEKCGYIVPDDLMLYCRREVHDLWDFMQNEVVAENEWNVVWIHLSDRLDSCLALGTKEYWDIGDLSSFELPRVAGKKLFICLDGYKATIAHAKFFKHVLTLLDKRNERVVVCSSMASLGNRNLEDDRRVNIQVFYVYSWTQGDYFAAIADQAFYNKIVSKLDATSATEVNEDDGFEGERSEEEKKKHAVDLKFYYAGGSCRFMFQYLTNQVMDSLKTALESVANKFDLVKYCGGSLHTDAVNRLYGMQRDGDGNGRFPVSSYVASLFAKECDEETITQLATRLNASNNPSMDGHLFEWLVLASVPKRAVKLFGDHEVEDVLPQANVLRFDPKKRFRVLPDGKIKGDRSWLQPIAWNQGGYDAVYFDKDKGKVIFVQVTRSDKHDFKMRFFYEVLLKLKMAGMEIKQVVVYFAIKPAQYIYFRMGHIEDRGVLYEFDKSWTCKEEDHVQVRAFEAPPVYM
ncbi:putative crinkler (CRN) family protein [Phytophthora cinnamomi]|uniref:putative crinkler (CRN) family protein n=1 Tax=Phytophthora cinnamomi TaxID=4785 RepID=UPI003559F675|nr:putative crinkler (CRN) family protein [Phytophthora cinnamomi]